MLDQNEPKSSVAEKVDPRNDTEDHRKACEAAEENSFQKLSRHRKTLDDSLSSFREGSPERDRARAYVVGQIDAIDWVMGVFST